MAILGWLIFGAVFGLVLGWLVTLWLNRVRTNYKRALEIERQGRMALEAEVSELRARVTGVGPEDTFGISHGSPAGVSLEVSGDTFAIDAELSRANDLAAELAASLAETREDLERATAELERLSTPDPPPAVRGGDGYETASAIASHPWPEEAGSAPGDDLTLLAGVGPQTEIRLKALGITTFRQLAELTALEVGELAKALRVSEQQIARNAWIETAAELAERASQHALS